MQRVQTRAQGTVKNPLNMGEKELEGQEEEKGDDSKCCRYPCGTLTPRRAARFGGKALLKRGHG